MTLAIGVSFWTYHQHAIIERNREREEKGKTIVKDEAWFKEAWTTEFKEKFELTRDLKFVFIDSWSQQPYNMDDAVQQNAFAVSTL